VLGGDGPEPVVGLIVERAGGNPFVLEELARAVREAEPGAPPAVPDTVQEVLLARVARLPEGPRHLLAIGAVLGGQPPRSLLAALHASPGDLARDLRALAAAEFLHEVPGGAEPAYAFTHALVQEVVYASVPGPERAALHAAAARALEALHADRLGEVADRLADHFARAGDAARAIHYLGRAADRAARTHAHAEAVAALRRALDQVGGRPAAEQLRPRVELTLRLASSLLPLGRIAESRAALDAEAPAVARLDDAGVTGQYHFLAGRAASFLGDHEHAAGHARRAIAAAERAGDELTLGKALSLLALEGPLAGEAREGIAHARRAVELLEHTGERTWLGAALWVLGLTYAQVGVFAPALAAATRAGELGEATGDRRLQTLAAWAAGMIHAAMGDAAAGLGACRRACERAPDPLNTAIARGWLGYAHLEAGDPGAAIPLLAASVRDLGEFRFGRFQGWFTVFLAEAHRLTGDLAAARGLAGEGLATMRETRFGYGLGWARRALGRIAAAGGDHGAAAVELGAAHALFRDLGARYEVARTELDLAALREAAGDAAAATVHLAEAGRLFRLLRVPRWAERAASPNTGVDP
jgi:hypothetical protein